MQLEVIAENMRSKYGLQLLASVKKSKITTTFHQPINSDPKKQYKLALLNLEIYYLFPNIDNGNSQYKKHFEN